MPRRVLLRPLGFTAILLYVLMLGMKTKLFYAALLFALGIVLCAGGAAQQKPAAKPAPKSSTPAAQKSESPAAKSFPAVTLNTSKEKASYAIGVSIGRNVMREGIDLDTALFVRGLTDALTGSKLLLSDEEARGVLMNVQKEMQAKHQAQGEANKKAGEAFLAANKTKEGVVTLPSGVQYKIVKQGDGPKPIPSDTVLCNYRGTLVDGKEFDSSYKRGEPASFPVGGVIKGWTEILQLMPVGSKYQVWIPSELAYGAQAPPQIGPNSTLIFEVELVSIKDKPAVAPGAHK